MKQKMSLIIFDASAGWYRNKTFFAIFFIHFFTEISPIEHLSIEHLEYRRITYYHSGL